MAAAALRIWSICEDDLDKNFWTTSRFILKQLDYSTIRLELDYSNCYYTTIDFGRALVIIQAIEISSLWSVRNMIATYIIEDLVWI